MKFEWDEAKNRENIRKHGIDFADVPAMFNQPMIAGLDVRHAPGEDRWIGIGRFNDIVTVIVFTERAGEVIRIISARKATRYERKTYEEAVAD